MQEESNEPLTLEQVQSLLSDIILNTSAANSPNNNISNSNNDSINSSGSRELALAILSKKRESFEDLPLMLWYSFGIISTLLQELTSAYPFLSPPSLTIATSTRVCNSLALLQCVAAHPETRPLFLNAHIPLYLYPFLNTTHKSRPFEFLRLTSLGVIGALVKADSTDVINFLLTTEIIPLCLRIMESGSELTKTVSIFVLQKFLMDDLGLSFICATNERLTAVAMVLASMTKQVLMNASNAAAFPAQNENSSSLRLMRHIIRCYLRLSENKSMFEGFQSIIPSALFEACSNAPSSPEALYINSLLKDDLQTKKCLQQLASNLGTELK